jgi:hypothetical protein
MRSTFNIDVAHPAAMVERLAQEAGDSVPGWRKNGALRWKCGSVVSWKNVGKAAVEVAPTGEASSKVTFHVNRLGLADPFGLGEKDYRDFYDKFEPLIRAETARAHHV